MTIRSLPMLALALSCCLLALPTSSARGQAEETFSDSIDVRVINLDVVVTDRSGERVGNLRPEDFRLRIGGEEFPIDYFTEVREGRAVGVTESAAGPLVREGDRVPVNYLVFVDAMWGFEGSVRRQLEGIRGDLDQLLPGDQISMMLYDGERLQRIQGWTQIRQQIDRAFDRALAGEFGGIDRYREGRDHGAQNRNRNAFLAEGGDPLNEAKIPEGEGAQYQFRMEELFGQMDRVTRAAAAAMQTSAPPAGRKVMLLLTGGGWISEFPESFTNGRRQEHLFRLTETANLLGFTLYVADTPLQRTGSQGLQHDALDFLADKTGGRSYKQASGIDVLERASADVATYYWMGFTAPSEGDGARYEIDLEVLKPGLKVRAREGFADMSRQEQIDGLVRSAALLGDLPSALPLEIFFGDAERKGRRMEVPLVVRIPLDGVTMLPTAEGHTARLEMRVSGIDDEGDFNDLPVIPVTFSGPEPGPGQVATYETTLRLRARKHTVLVALYDLASGNILLGEEILDL